MSDSPDIEFWPSQKIEAREPRTLYVMVTPDGRPIKAQRFFFIGTSDLEKTKKLAAEFFGYDDFEKAKADGHCDIRQFDAVD